MKVMAKEMSLNTFHFVTNKAILMSDFGITPPLAALGMVKVRDEINISLDMVVSIE